jgi:N utilization substance protein A
VRVDIRSETQLAEGIPSGGRDAEVEYADGEWIANAETGEMEWHAADGSVVSESAWQAQTEEPAAEGAADDAGSTGDAADSTGDAAASTGDELLADAEVLTDSENDTASAVDEIAAQEGDDAGEAAAEPADAESTSEDDDA